MAGNWTTAVAADLWGLRVLAKGCQMFVKVDVRRMLEMFKA
jgi:hypothetical protein